VGKKKKEKGIQSYAHGESIKKKKRKDGRFAPLLDSAKEKKGNGEQKGGGCLGHPFEKK